MPDKQPAVLHLDWWPVERIVLHASPRHLRRKLALNLSLLAIGVGLLALDRVRWRTGRGRALTNTLGATLRQTVDTSDASNEKSNSADSLMQRGVERVRERQVPPEPPLRGDVGQIEMEPHEAVVGRSPACSSVHQLQGGVTVDDERGLPRGESVAPDQTVLVGAEGRVDGGQRRSPEDTEAGAYAVSLGLAGSGTLEA